MPLGDKTGPTGSGPMTGRRAGYCSGSGMPGYRNVYAGGRGFGFGFGRGRGFGGGFGGGFGRGFGRGYGYYGAPPAYYPPDPAYDPYAVWQLTPKQELEMLQSQTKDMESELSAMKKRIAELEKENKGK
jgi:hypothetical protein